MRIASRHRPLAVEEVIRGLRVQQRHAAIVQRHVHILAEARSRPLMQRHQDADRRVEPGGDIDDRRAEPKRARSTGRR